MAFRSFPGLCDLQEKNGVDLGNRYRNDHSCRDFVMATAKVTADQLKDEIVGSRFLVVMGDGSTDIIVEQEGVFVR